VAMGKWEPRGLCGIPKRRGNPVGSRRRVRPAPRAAWPGGGPFKRRIAGIAGVHTKLIQDRMLPLPVRLAVTS
jgi:hypothetical protein